MKRNILLMLLILTLSCSKDNESAKITIEVSYFYNDFVGSKPDTGAKAFLFDHSKTGDISIDSMSVIDARLGKLTDKDGEWLDLDYLYSGEAGASGMISLDNLTPGYYLLILASEGRYSFTHKHQHIESGEDLKLVKNFNYYNEFKPGGETW